MTKLHLTFYKPSRRVYVSAFLLFTFFVAQALTPISKSSVSVPFEGPYIYILGVAQDAGYPQAGCFRQHCMQGWLEKDKRVMATSLAVVDTTNRRKYLFEATPNLPDQLFLLEQQAPEKEFKLDGIFITHAHIGHYTGLMYFGREAMGAKNMPVYVMPKMSKYLTSNGPWDQLVKLNNIAIKELSSQRAVDIGTISITPFLVPHRDEYSETVGFKIKGPRKTALFIPDINKWSEWSTDLAEQVQKVDYAFLDATFFDDMELPGRDMSKIPHPFVTETMETLKDLTYEQKSKVWFIHMNHTNPLLDGDSLESKLASDKGFRVATEGLRLPL